LLLSQWHVVLDGRRKPSQVGELQTKATCLHNWPSTLRLISLAGVIGSDGQISNQIPHSYLKYFKKKI